MEEVEGRGVNDEGVQEGEAMSPPNFKSPPITSQIQYCQGSEPLTQGVYQEESIKVREREKKN